MKKILSILMMSIIVILCFFMLLNNDYKENDLIRVAIYPIGTSNESYYFVMTEDKEFIAEKGIRNHRKNISQNGFMKKIEEVEKKKISDDEMENLLISANEIITLNNIPEDRQWLDSWKVEVFYENIHIIQTEGFESPEITKLIDRIIELSPIEVDMHGWA